MKSGDMHLRLQSMLRGGIVRGAGVDFLTVTTTDEAAKRNLLDIFNRGAAQAERLGDRRKKMGFQGFQGFQSGPWFYGRRDELWLLRIKGGIAHDVFHDLPWPALNCSRIDVQITLELPKYEQDLARTAAEARALYAREKNIKLTPVQDLRGLYGSGQTLYIGSRESPRFGRIYDKDQQSQEEIYKNCWRWEVEYKKICAPLVVEWLRQEPDLRIAAMQSVIGQYGEWGLPLNLGVTGRLIAGSIGRRDYDSERSMKWLREQVAPTIERLLGTVDQETIEEALGLRKAPEPALPFSTREWLRETGQETAELTGLSQSQRDGRKWW